MIDPFGRHVSYLRVSVTDRCDFRCVYCMAENMTFLPKKDMLTLEELDRLCSVFVEKGVKKLRLTGGEPLVRRNIMSLFENLSRHLKSGALEELTLTTNGSQLRKVCAASLPIAACAHQRVARHAGRGEVQGHHPLGRPEQGLAGLKAAQEAGLAVKINMVALKNVNEHEIVPMIEWCHGQGMDLTLIETMPLGEIEEDRTDQYLPLSVVRANLLDILA
jgi:cyclic pyranopterin phosphate synthase